MSKDQGKCDFLIHDSFKNQHILQLRTSFTVSSKSDQPFILVYFNGRVSFCASITVSEYYLISFCQTSDCKIVSDGTVIDVLLKSDLHNRMAYYPPVCTGKKPGCATIISIQSGRCLEAEQVKAGEFMKK